MSSNKKKIGIQLPRQANPEEVAIRYSLELEALDPVAEIIEVGLFAGEEPLSEMRWWPFVNCSRARGGWRAPWRGCPR